MNQEQFDYIASLNKDRRTMSASDEKETSAAAAPELGAQPDQAGATFAATVALHKEHAADEPLELDVDVAVTCDCGHRETERQQLYKEHDEATVMCAACGAEYLITVVTVVTFEPTAAKVSAGVISSAMPRARRGVPHAP